MNFEPLQKRDARLVALVFGVIAIAAWYTLRNYEAAFPQASLRLQYSKSEITAKAEAFLEERGLSTEGYRQLTIFDSDHQARLFLERKLGLAEANRLMESEVAVWRWRARWFKPPEEEEFSVLLSPDGRLVGYQHVIPEARSGARLNQEAALEIASRFLQQQTSLPHRLIEEQLQQRPNRDDYVFAWEQSGFQAGDATYRRRVVIRGDEVGEYAEYLHVPERWEREYAALRSSNQLFTGIAQAFYILLILAAIGVLLGALRRHEVRWRPLIVICGAAGTLAVCNEWNQLSFYIDRMPTSSAYLEMLLSSLLQGLGAGVGYFFYIALAAAPGEPLYRASQPERLSLFAAFSGKGIRTREFFRATVAGYGFAAAHLIFLVAFYLVSKRFGAWSPQDVGYSNLLSTAAPWLYPLSIGVLASTSEEFWFRLLAIPLLKRYVGSTWIAVLLPAFIWGFLHSNYPQQPGFIRGIEVGIVGVAAGLIFLRFGIVATLIWHYTIDAVLVSTILFESDSVYFWISGLIVSGAVLIPLGLSLFHYRANGGFLSDTNLLNANVPSSPPSARIEAPAVPAEPLRPRWPRRWLYIAAVAALVAGVFLRPPQFGDFMEIRVSAAEANAIADRALATRDMDPRSWQRATTFVDNLDTADFEYIRRLRGVDAANRAVRERTFHGVWLIRYLRPMQQEEWRVYVDQQGAPYRVDHLVEETSAGADLSPEQARTLAERYLRDRVPLAEFRLVDSREEKRQHRTDHHLVWEEAEYRIGDATARISLSVIGDEVSSFRKFLKLPEEWLREFHKPRLSDYIVPALAGAIAFPLLIVFLRQIGSRDSERRARFHWRIYSIAGAVAVLAAMAGAANQWVAVMASYNTAEPLQNYITQWLLGRLIMVLLAGLGLFILTMAADAFLQLAAGHRRLPAPNPLRSIAVVALVWGLYRALAFADFLVPGDRFNLPIWRVTPETALPAIGALTSSLFAAALLVGLSVIVGSAVCRYLLNRTGAILIAVALAMLAISSSTNAAQWSFHFAEFAVLLFLAVFLVRTCGVDLAGFAVAVFWLQAARLGGALASQPEPFLQWNGISAIVLAVTAGLLVLWSVRRRSRALAQGPIVVSPER